MAMIIERLRPVVQRIEPADRFIVALDTSDLYQALRWVRLLCGLIDSFKIGLEFIRSCGNDGIWALRELGVRNLFFDEKFSDTGRTMRGAVMADCLHHP